MEDSASSAGAGSSGVRFGREEPISRMFACELRKREEARGIEETREYPGTPVPLDGHEMVFHMKTTLTIADSVMERLREASARRGITMSALVEAGLRVVLAERVPSDHQADRLPPLPTWRSGGFRVDIANREALYRMMEEE